MRRPQLSERFDLSNYKTVEERITEAKALFPQGRFQTELLVLPPGLAEKYVAVKARFFRHHDDPTPGEGVAWETVPGKTPYTKDSELQNAETSAWGRALVAALVVDTSKGIASRQEVRRQRDNETTAPDPTPPNPEMKSWALVQMTRLLDAVGGDKEIARSHWEALLRANDLDPKRVPSPEHKEVLETEMALLVGELVGLEPVS
jgi:hypothetical protein